MNIPKEVRLRTVVILLSSLLVLSSVSIYYAFSASTPTSGLTDIYIEPPMMESSYIIGIYTAPATCYLKNGTSGEITTTGSFYTCLQYSIDTLTTGGKTFLRAGRYNLTEAIIISGVGSNALYFEGEAFGGVGEPGVQIDYGLAAPGALITYGGVDRNWYGGWSNIHFRGTSVATSKAINIQGWISDLFFSQCGFTYFDVGVMIQGASTSVGEAKTWNFWFDQCLFENNVHYGVAFSNTDSLTLRFIDRVKITNCHFYDNLNGIYVYPDAPYVFHVTITGNSVQSERQAFINVSYGGSGRQWIVSDNQIFDCGIGANGTMAAIMVNGTGWYPDSWLIENNIIANHFTSAPVAMNNSIWLTGTVTNFVIQGNFFFQASEPIRIDGLKSYSSIMVNGNDDYAKNLVFPTEVRAYSYIIGAFKSTYFMLNCSTGDTDYQSTNLTNVEKFALGNTTNGVIYLKELQHNTSLSISATQIVMQQYQGQIKYFTDSGSSSVTDCPVATTGNFTFPSGTGETTILTLATPTSITKLHNLYIDLSVLTQNCTLRVYINFTGSYVEMTGMTVEVAAGSKGMPLKDMMINTAWKLTIQSTVAEGATRYLYYQYFAETY